jgi:NADPH:quinone reductase-like Zn-dependent oxidoreductase
VVLTGHDDVAWAIRDAAGHHEIDMIIDPLWGEPALAAMRSPSRHARLIQIGNSASPTIKLPAGVLRPDLLQIVGFGVMDVPIDERREAYRTLTDHAARGQITVDVMPLPLADVAAASEQQKRGAPAKLVLTP